MAVRRSSARRAAASLLEGVLLFVGALLVADAVRGLFGGSQPVVSSFLRRPGGFPLPSVLGLLPGPALLVKSRASALVLTAALLLALLNAVEHLVLRSAGLPAAPLPFTLLSAALFAAGIARTLREGPAASKPFLAAGAVLAGPVLALLVILTFGLSDYTRPADAVVVLGARVHEDGRPSLALEDRVAHGARLVLQGVAPRLVLSGAPDEVPVMIRLARAAGVGADAIDADPRGVNTWETFRNLRVRRVVAVSHYYHLARIKLAAGRLGIGCVTAPCRMTRRLAKEPWFVARECAALAWYYLRRV